MARLETALDIANVDRSADQPMDLLPVGDYLLELTAIEQKRDGASISHAYTYEVVEPEQYKKRRIWDWIDLQSEAGMEWKAKKGEARLANLCDSVGWDSAAEGVLDDDEKIMFRSFMAKVGQQAGGVSKAGKAFKPKNVVERFYKPDDADAPSGANIYADQPKLPAAPAANDNKPAAQAARPAAAAAGGVKKNPWSK
jgi:hypothetical protein